MSEPQRPPRFRPLGRGGPAVSLLGLGTWPIGGGMGAVDERAGMEIVHAALDLGITLIDTAQGYRTSEAIIGRALQGGRREKAFLATKATFDFSPRGIESALEASLRALRTDRVDLYQIHSWKPEYPIEASMETLVRMREHGKVRFLGVSNFDAVQMAAARRASRFESNQVLYNLFDPGIEKEVIPYCAREGIAVIVHSPLAKGLLAGKYADDQAFPADDERSGFPRFQEETFRGYLRRARRLQERAAALGLTLPQLALAWAMQPPEVASVLVGVKSRAQLEELLPAMEACLTSAERDELRRLAAA